MILFYFSLGLSVLYVLAQAQNLEKTQYDTLVSLNNHTSFLNDVFVKGLKIDFNDYLIKDPSFKNVIDFENVLKDSEISFLCDKNIPDLNNSVALNYTKKYPGILLCMGLSHILLLNGILLTQQQGSGKISMALPKTRSELDSLVSTMNSNNTLKENVMCKEHKVTLPTYHSDVEDYVKLLNPMLDNENTCETMCLISDTINPICALIMEANSVFYQNLKEWHVNATAQVENVDSAKALEQNSVNDMALPNTKEITDDFKETVPVNKGNVAAVELNKEKVTVVINDTNNIDTVAEPAVPSEQNMTSTTPSISKVAVDAAEDLINDDSGENTDNAEEDNAETVKQPSPSPAPVVTETKTRPATNGTLATQPNSKPVLLEEDNAKEAVEADPPTNSEIKETPEQKTKPAEETKETSVPKNIPPSTKTSEKTVDADKNELELGDPEDNLPPPLQDPPAPNEGDNILLNANNDDDDTFSSNVDQKQQVADPGDAVLDIQENTPYIIAKDGFVEAEDSHFFMYFVLMFVICIVLYVGFYNKRKLLALALEGRSGRRARTRRGTYSRVNTNFDESKDHLLY